MIWQFCYFEILEKTMGGKPVYICIMKKVVDTPNDPRLMWITQVWKCRPRSSAPTALVSVAVFTIVPCKEIS